MNGNGRCEKYGVDFFYASLFAQEDALIEADLRKDYGELRWTFSVKCVQSRRLFCLYSNEERNFVKYIKLGIIFMHWTAPSISREHPLPLHWVASSKKDYQAFPQEIQADMGYALGLAQLGAKHPHAKLWKGEGPDIFEIVEDHMGDTYRAVYTVRFVGVVYVLHAFQKKSKTGIKTPQADVKLIKDRLKRAQQDYENRGKA